MLTMRMANHCPNCFQKLNEPEAEHRLCPNCGFDFTANPQPEAALPWNTLLHERYIIGRVLGQGGFAVTYAGMDTNLQCRVAVKEYRPQGAASWSWGDPKSPTLPGSQNIRDLKTGADSFLREARKMARIGSIPGIVRVIDTFMENDTSYIIMDYVEGVTLRKYIAANGPMSLKRCIDMLTPLCEAIDRMHQKGMIHRDISPDNIMVRKDGTLWLLDFGAAKDMEANAGSEASAVVAKKGFSPPEQYSGKNIGPWTDVYALCATMYFCVTGRPLPDMFDRMEDDRIQWTPLEVPNYVRDAFEQGLSVKYSKRIQNVSQLLYRLGVGKTGDAAPQEEQRSPQTDSAGGPGTGNETEVVTGPGMGNETEVVAGPGEDYGYSVSIDPITEETAKRKRGSLAKRIPVIAAAVLVICGGVFAVSQLGNGTAAEKETEENGTSSAAEIEAEESEPVQSSPEVDSGSCGENLTWRLDESGVLTVSGTGEMTDFEYAATPWNGHKNEIRSVVIGSGVTSVGSYAFMGCEQLTDVAFSDTVTRIGMCAFEYCAFTEVSLPDGLRIIDNDAFFQCSSLTGVEIPDSVTSIGFAPFGYCSSLKAISVSAGNADYCSENGVLYNKDKTQLIQYPGGGPDTFAIPESVTRIGDIAFGGNEKLITVTVCGSRVRIGARAFQNCTALKTLTILEDGGSIDEFAFGGCFSLASLIFMGSAPSIESGAFMDDTLTIFYPADDPTWTAALRSRFAGEITWKAN